MVFAAAHIPLEQAVHVVAVSGVLSNLANDPLLGARQLEGNPALHRTG